jgi:protein-L-isoaspartate(D-aspartate) O-methyltransferase
MSSESDDDLDANNINAFLRALLLRGDDRIRTNESLVNHLKQTGVLVSNEIEMAFLNVPRANFLPREMEGSAYNDSPLRLSKMGFNISAPHMYAMCFEQLDIEPGNHILDIGCGTGHFTVMAGYLTGPDGFVHGLDIHKHIIKFAEGNYRRYDESGGVDMNILFECRNCFLPDPHNRKYDRIHVGACVPESHLEYLQNLLNPGGILVVCICIFQ